MALTSSAALGTSEDDCNVVSKDEDLEWKKKDGMVCWVDIREGSTSKQRRMKVTGEQQRRTEESKGIAAIKTTATIKLDFKTKLCDRCTYHTEQKTSN